MNNKWTNEEINKLTEIYYDNTYKEMSEIINRSESALRAKSSSLGLVKNKNWSEDEIYYLKENHNKKDIDIISNYLKRSIIAIKTKALKLNISSNNFWSEKEINYLKVNYSKSDNNTLSIELHKNIKAISSKANKLGLKKSKEHKSKMIAKRNKMVGRDLTLENLKKIAKNYKTRGQFQIFDPSAYTTARRTEHMEEICSHMIKSTSIPQLIMTYIIKDIFDCDIIMNDRTKIKPYELDIYIPKYNIAFEYDGKLWHDNNSNDTIKNNLCKKENILLLRLPENNRNYIKDIKSQLISKLEDINSFSVLKLNINMIEKIDNNDINEFINSQILDDKLIKDIVSKYTTYIDFKENEPKLYSKLNRMKAINKYLDALERDRIYWTEEKINIEISKYKTLEDFINNSNGCYIYCKRNKIDLSILKRKKQTYSINDIINTASKYELLSNFKKDFPKYYVFIKNHKFWEIIKHLKRYKKHI